MDAKQQRWWMAGLSLAIGLLASFFLLALGFAGKDIAWSLQSPGFWLAGAFGLSVHGGALYLVAALTNTVSYAVVCFCLLWMLTRLLAKKW